MDKTINKLIIGFVILVVFDCTSFTVEKGQWGMLNGVLHTVTVIKQTINVFK